MNHYILKSLETQIRVIYALMMREVHTIYGRTKLGYLWAIIHTAVGVTVMWMFRTMCGMATPHGMNMLTYLIVGYSIWNIMAGETLKCMKAIESNRTLLTFPQVSTIDVMLSRCIIIICTEIVSSFIILFIGYCLGYEFYVSNIGGILYALFLTFAIGLGFGMILSSLNSYFSTIERIVPIFFRLLMFASGVFFSVTSFTGHIGNWILWNPFLQIIEFTRTCISNGYPADFVSHKYLIQFSLYTLSLGLLLEKFSRKRSLA